MVFLNPSALWLLPGLGIPILIHLFNFQRTEKIIFSNTRLLFEVVQQTRKARQLKGLILLILRILGLAFLILAFAQPTWNKEAKSVETGIQSVAVFVDNSRSMFFPEDESRAFDKALAVAKSIPAKFQGKGWFQLIDHNFLAQNTWQSSSGFKDHLLDLNISEETKSLSSIINRAIHQIRFLPEANQANVWLISDFQKSGANSISDLPFDSLHRYRLVHLAHKSLSNIWVDSVWLPKPLSAESGTHDLRVRIQCRGSAPEKPVRIQLFANENLVSGKLIKTNPQAAIVATLPVRINAGQLLRCRLQVDDPGIEFDNAFYFVLRAPKPISIHLISSDPTSVIPKIYNNPMLFRSGRSTQRNPDYPGIDRADLVILEGFKEVGNSLLDLLIRKTTEGGTLVLIPGSSGNELIQDWANKTGLPLATPLNASDESDKAQNIDNPSRDNAFFRDAFQSISPGSRKARAKPQIRIKGGNSLLKFESGLPFLVQKTMAKGEVFMLASNVSGKESGLSQHPIVIPLFYKMSYSSVRSDPNELYFSCGGGKVRMGSDSLEKYKDAGVELVQENKKYIAAIEKQGSGIVVNLPEDPLSEGFWEIRKNGKLLGDFAMNSSRMESLPEFYSEEELKTAFAGKPWVTVSGVSDSASPEHLQNEKNDDFGFWKYCIWIAILMFVLEILIIRLGAAGKIA